MRKILTVPAMTLGMALLASCNLNSSDSGKNEVSNFEDLPNCSELGSTSGTSPLGEKVRVEEEEVSYVCTDSGWVVVSVAEYKLLPACPAKRDANLGLKVFVDEDSLQYICVKTGWIEYDSTAADGSDPSPTADSSLVSGSARAIGPFGVGAVVQLREVVSNKDSAFVLSDSVFKGIVTGKTGEFMIPKVTTYANWGVVTVKGLYKDALKGVVSEDSLELEALVELGYDIQVQVDVYSHLVAARVKALVNSGSKFSYAITQAEKELAQTFGFDPNAGEEAVRQTIALLLRADLDESGFADAIETLATDFAEDGTWDDDDARTALADFAFNIQNLKLKDEETGEVLLKESDYRKNLEKFGIKDIAAFEGLFTDFWVASYGLGGCGYARQNAVVMNANESSDSAKAYFMCDNESWRVATDFERDTVNLGNAEDGVLREGNVNKKKLYVYDTTGFGIGETTRWKEPDSVLLVIGHACTDFEDVINTVVSTKDKNGNKNYYGCKDRSWTSVEESVYEIGYMCNKTAKNVVEKYKHDKNDAYARCRESKQESDDGTVMYSYFWEGTTEVDYDHRDEDCTPYEVKGTKTKYYCTDADNIRFVEADDDEAELGVCYEAVEGTFGAYKDKNDNDVYRLCGAGYVEGTWMWQPIDEHTYKLESVCDMDHVDVVATYKGKDDKDVYVMCSENYGTYSWTVTDAATYKMQMRCDEFHLGSYWAPDNTASYTCGCEVERPIEPTPTEPPYTETVIVTVIGDPMNYECSAYGPFTWHKD